MIRRRNTDIDRIRTLEADLQRLVDENTELRSANNTLDAQVALAAQMAESAAAETIEHHQDAEVLAWARVTELVELVEKMKGRIMVLESRNAELRDMRRNYLRLASEHQHCQTDEEPVRDDSGPMLLNPDTDRPAKDNPPPPVADLPAETVAAVAAWKRYWNMFGGVG